MKTLRINPEDRILVISDTHICTHFNRVSEIIELCEEADFVVFNGDIFELFVQNPKKVLSGNGAGKDLIEWMKKNKNKFVYIVGNHDEALWDIEDTLFFPIYSEVRIIQGKESFIITHGNMFDCVNRYSGWKVKILFWLEYLCNIIFRVIWQDIIFRRKLLFSKIGYRKRDSRLPDVRNNAEKYAVAIGAKTLIHGHTHFPEDRKLNGYRIIDQGSFVIGTSYVIIHREDAILISDW